MLLGACNLFESTDMKRSHSWLLSIVGNQAETVSLESLASYVADVKEVYEEADYGAGCDIISSMLKEMISALAVFAI